MDLLKVVKPAIDLFVVGRLFKVSELFGPIYWESYSQEEKEKYASEFEELTKKDFANVVEIFEKHDNRLLQVYKKVEGSTLKKPKDVFPDKPVTIKRNERGNA